MYASTYRRLLGYPEYLAPHGGQELIAVDIAACIPPEWGPCHVVLPFASTPSLAGLLRGLGHQVTTHSRHAYRTIPPGDVLYFGTPTIVNGRALFPDPEQWSVDRERRIVRSLCSQATALRYRQIISGLGSGDISVDDRLADMGAGSRVVAHKVFECFEDWVLERRL